MKMKKRLLTTSFMLSLAISACDGPTPEDVRGQFILSSQESLTLENIRGDLIRMEPEDRHQGNLFPSLIRMEPATSENTDARFLLQVSPIMQRSGGTWTFAFHFSPEKLSALSEILSEGSVADASKSVEISASDSSQDVDAVIRRIKQSNPNHTNQVVTLSCTPEEKAALCEEKTYRGAYGQEIPRGRLSYGLPCLVEKKAIAKVSLTKDILEIELLSRSGELNATFLATLNENKTITEIEANSECQRVNVYRTHPRRPKASRHGGWRSR
jgi:hypothetical protein